MAQLKDTLITGGLRVTDTTITDILLTSAIKAPVDSASGTIGLGSNGLVLTSNGTNTYWSSDVLTANDAMVFKGTLGTNGTVVDLPSTDYSAGWTYRVATAGTYAGEYCEAGDLIIAVKDYISPGADTDWAKIEHNIDGAIFTGSENGAANKLTENKLIYATGDNQVASSNITIDGNNLSGNASTANAFSSALSITLTGDTSGTASSTAGWEITTKTDRLSTVGDNRSIATLPSDYSDKLIFLGLKTNSIIDSPSSDTYSYLIGLSGWKNTTGGNTHELAFNNSGIYWRNGDSTWGSWNKLAIFAETNDLWGDNGNLATGVKTYFTLDITTPSNANNRIFGTLKVGNYSSNTVYPCIISFYFYWDKETFSNGYYYDPTNSINGLTLIKDNDGKIYLLILHRIRYVNFWLYVNTSLERSKGNRAIAYTSSANPVVNATITKEALKIVNYAYGICDTIQTQKAKEVTLSTTWVISNGIVLIKFTYGTKIAAATLNINDTGAKPILYNGAAITADENIIKPDDVATFLYTGTNYYLIAVDNSFTAGSFGTSSNSSPGFGGTFTIPYITTDKHGRVTAISNTTITLPSSDNSDTLVNLEAKTDAILYKILATAKTLSGKTAEEAVFVDGITITPNTKTITTSIYLLDNKAEIQYNATTNAIDFNFI